MPTIQPVLFGKLPLRPDFLRVNAAHPAAREFDDWLQQSLALLGEEDGWESAHAEVDVAGFQYFSRDGRHVFLGALQPSHDESGRRFPLVGGMAVDTEWVGANAEISPIACEVLLNHLRVRLRHAVETASEALECQAFLQAQAALGGTGLADFTLARAVGDRYLASTPMDSLDRLLRAANPATSLVQAVLNIAFYRAFLRRFNAPSAYQAIVLPLPGAKGEAALAASAWLRLVHAAGRGNDTGAPMQIPYLMWRSAGQSWRLVTGFRRWPASTGAMVLGGPCKGNAVFDLAEVQPAWESHALYAEAAYALQRLAGDASTSLSELHRFLGELGRKLDRDT